MESRAGRCRSRCPVSAASDVEPSRNHDFLKAEYCYAAEAGALAPPDEDLLIAWPRVLSDIRIGYARVSTGSQNLDRQPTH